MEWNSRNVILKYDLDLENWGASLWFQFAIFLYSESRTQHKLVCAIPITGRRGFLRSGNYNHISLFFLVTPHTSNNTHLTSSSLFLGQICDFCRYFIRLIEHLFKHLHPRCVAKERRFENQNITCWWMTNWQICTFDLLIKMWE